MTRSRVQVKISGYVQGVGYRYFAVDKARALGLNGYVRNTGDGGVEVIAEGEKRELDELVGSLKEGCAASTVADIRTSYSDYLGEFDGFSIK